MPPISIVLVWSRSEPRRVGERVFVTPEPATLGREARQPHQLSLQRAHGAQATSTGPLQSVRLSREQVRIRAAADSVHIERVGQRRLLIDGTPADAGPVPIGGCFEIDSEVLFYVEGPWAPVATGLGDTPWGTPDHDGMVGETPAVWQLRRDLDREGAHARDVWVVGPSGAGRIRAAQGIHRRGRPGRLLLHDEDRLHAGDTVIVPATKLAPLADRSEIRRLVIADPTEVPRQVAHRVNVPGLDARRADIPLLARQVLLEWSLTQGRALARHVDDHGEPKLSIELMRFLLAVDLPQHEHSLADLLWQSIETSPQSRLAPPSEARNVRSAAWEMDFTGEDDTLE